MGSKVAHPLLELQGFQRAPLRSGETKTVRLPLQASALTYWDDQTGSLELEKDHIEVLVESTSAEIAKRKTGVTSTIDASPSQRDSLFVTDVPANNPAAIGADIHAPKDARIPS